MIIVIEAICSILGMIGTLLIIRRNKLGYCCYFPSNILWVFYGYVTDQFFFMSQYVFYTVTAITGFAHWNNLDKKERNNNHDVESESGKEKTA